MKRQESKILGIVARNIRSQRHSLGVSQEELADLAGVHRTYIGMIERSEKNVTVLSLEKIAKALNVSVDVLLKDDK